MSIVKKPIYYLVRLGETDAYLCGVQHRGTPYWGRKWAASETTQKRIALEWATQHGGIVEQITGAGA